MFLNYCDEIAKYLNIRLKVGNYILYKVYKCGGQNKMVTPNYTWQRLTKRNRSRIRGHPRHRTPLLISIDDAFNHPTISDTSIDHEDIKILLPDNVPIQTINGKTLYIPQSSDMKPDTVLGDLYTLSLKFSMGEVPQKILYSKDVPPLITYLNGGGAYEMLLEIAKRNSFVDLSPVDGGNTVLFSMEKVNGLKLADDETRRYITWVGYTRNLGINKLPLEVVMFDENLSILKEPNNVALLKFTPANDLGMEFLDKDKYKTPAYKS